MQNLNPRWIDCPAGHMLDADEAGGMTTKPRYQTLVDGASIAWDAALGAVAEVTITEARVMANPTNLKAGEQYVLIVRGAYSLTWGDAYEWGTEPTLAAENVFVFQCDGTKLYPIESGGGSYTLPTASADTLGGVKVAAPVTITDSVLGVSAATTSAAGLILVPTNLYARATQFARASANSLGTPAINVEVDGSLLSFAAGTIGLDTAGSWDASTYATPANRAGKDFYVYATADGLVLSANATYPTGYTAANSRKIGGFHCLCVAVGTISGHPLSGFLAGDILPASCWDLNHRPICSPEGMVYSEAAGIWVDIYLQSGTGTATKSVNGGTITDTRTWMDHVDDLGAVGKRLLDDGEFQRIAEGCNQETNIAGSADPGTTTGHTDTAGRRMISNIGCEDCAGVMYQWLLDQSYRIGTGAAWDWYDLPGAKGSLYNYSTDGQADVKLLAGGYWVGGAYCGSRCRFAHLYRWRVGTTLGARGCCGAGLAG